jgi:peptidoglycan/LPS O-acetylase OafA/YrhL
VLSDRTISNPSERGHVAALDLLRLVAVLSVMLFHFGFNGPPGPTGAVYVALPGLSAFARYGYLGVQLFFVISGFVIAHSAENRGQLDFAIGRVARIYPAFVVCMSATFLVTLTFGAPAFATSWQQWAANLIIGAPALHQPYIDNVYWTLLLELTFYAWICLLMQGGRLKQRIDAVVLIWLLLSLLNQQVIDSHVLRKIFLTDQSGFFAAGLLLYEIHGGRRDARVQGLLALATACAVFQAVSNVEMWRIQTGASFDDLTVAAISLAIIAVTAFALRVRRVPLPAGMALAIGGLTYPFYLLHQKIGYVAFLRLDGLGHPALRFVLIALAMLALSWATWKFVDRPGQRLAKRVLTRLVSRLGGAPVLRAKTPSAAA